MSNTTTGDKLTPEDQKEALAAYVHRFTGDHKPAWAKNGKWINEKEYPLQFKDDADWLAHTEFQVLKNGRLDHRATYCHSLPTWPLNPELRK